MLFSDPTGESGDGPDISSVVVADDSVGTLTFSVDLPNRPNGLQEGEAIWFAFDSDNNSATGPPFPVSSGGASTISSRSTGREPSAPLRSRSGILR